MARGRKALKWTAGAVGVLIVLTLLALAAVSIYLTPQRLTALVNRYGNEALYGGRLHASRVELTVWRTFPHTTLEVDSLLVVNPQFAAGGDTLLYVPAVSGRINLAALLIGRISVGHLLIDSPQATLWTDSTGRSNADIFPPSEPKDEEPRPLSLPDIRIDRFAITGVAAARYVAVADSIDATLTLRLTELKGHKAAAPNYRMQVDGAAALMPYLAEPVTVALDGGVGWKSKTPLAVSLHDFYVAVDSLQTRTSLVADFSDGMTINALDFTLLPTPLQRLASLVPDLPHVSTGAMASARCTLRAPYRWDADTLLIPDASAEFEITPSHVTVPDYHLYLSDFGLKVTASLSPQGLDRSQVAVERLHLAFPGTDVSVDGQCTNLATDPTLEGCIKGDIDFGGLDRRIWPLLGMKMRGRLDTDVDFRFPLSALQENGFHRLQLDGYVDLAQLGGVFPADSLVFWTDRTRLEFGTHRKVGPEQRVVDSLFSIAAKSDSLVVLTPGLEGRLSNLYVGFGVENNAASLDTSTVTPMGGMVLLKRANVTLADSTRAMLRDLDFGAVFTRYRGDGKRPLLALRGSVKRVAYADGVTRGSIRQAVVSTEAHLQPRRQRKALTAADSLRMRSRRDSMLLAREGMEHIDFAVDRSLVRMLKQWDVRGVMSAQSARVATPLMPLRMRLTDLDFAFNPDSLTLRDLRLKAGRSDFRLHGIVSNMQRALGRRHGQPLKASLTLESDTINVNELVQAAMNGSAWAQSGDTIAAAAVDLNDEPEIADTEASGEMRAIVVPMNIDASFAFRAKNIVYSSLLLNDFSGEVIVDRGAAHLSDLHASTVAGSADLNMLYYAPTVDNVDVGLSLELNRFRIGAVDRLLPSLDTIMPLLRDLDGVVDLSLGVTTRLDSAMNVLFPTARAMLFIEGDSLRVLDEKTFKTMAKWLFFRDKSKNMIDHMEVELAVEDSQLELFPFMFDFDRYRIGVMGRNDLDMNLDYHVSILKSPIPFKFGVNVKGSPGKLKIRPGRARFRENMVGERIHLADTLRLNLASEIKSALRRGRDAAAVAPMEVVRPDSLPPYDEAADTISAADSLIFRQNGLEL